MNIRLVLYVLGVLLSALTGFMAIPLAMDLAVGHPDWQAFLVSMILTGFAGGLLMVTHKVRSPKINVREAFLLTTLIWIAMALFAALPFYFSDLGISFTDAFFESMSGITTTGASVLIQVEQAPPGILIWRALLQWLGGVGIVVMAMSVLPFLKVGGMQLFRTESSEKDKLLPRAASFCASIGSIYLLLTLLCTISYMFGGLSLFDALAHAMTTISTGGFSTFDGSFARLQDGAGLDNLPDWRGASNFEINSGLLQWTAVLFMVLGALPFALFLRALSGDFRSLIEDTQVRWFLSIAGLAALTMALYLSVQGYLNTDDVLTFAAFNVVSIMTGTGYTSANFSLWGPFALGLLFFLMCVGGCAGSTACGIKIFRFQVLAAVAHSQIMQLIYPHGVFQPRYNGRILPKGVSTSVMGFFFLFALSFTVLALILLAHGLDFLTSLSGAVSAISNVGPGLGPIIGPDGSYAPLPDGTKWALCFGMLLGRLELFTVLVLLVPRFWRP